MIEIYAMDLKTQAARDLAEDYLARTMKGSGHVTGFQSTRPIAARIADELSDKPRTMSQIVDDAGISPRYSRQARSALDKMVREGKAVRVKDGRYPFYAVPE